MLYPDIFKLIILILSLASGTAVAQQPAFFDSDCPELTAPNNATTFGSFITIGGMDAVEGEDFVGFVDSEGFVIGSGAISVIDGNSNMCPHTITTFTAFPVYGFQPPGTAGEICPPDFGANDNEVITGLIYDGSINTYFTMSAAFTYENGEPGLTQPNPCTPTMSALVQLPVGLADFRGQVQRNGTVDLDWTTSHEYASSHFDVERSRNGDTWETLDRLASAGNSQGARHYSFTDAKPLDGTNFYRLRMVDADGSTELSGIVIIEIDREGSARVSTFPNPVRASGRLGMRLAGDWLADEPIRAALYDAGGRRVLDYPNLAAGTVSVTLPDHVAPGLYVLRATQGNRTATHRVLINGQ